MPDDLKILLVEDCPSTARLVQVFLARSQSPAIQATHVMTLREALALLHSEEFDLVLLDLGLPDSDGLDTVRCVTASAPELPLVVLTSTSDEEISLQAITEGAQEFLSKEHLLGHLLIRVIRHSIARQKKLLEAQSQALIDSLTGLGNRRYFDLELDRSLAEASRSGSGFGLIIFDIDHFKSINDGYGHLHGDEVLRMVAETFKRQVRTSDLAARIGGEEFAVLVRSEEIRIVWELAERIRTAISKCECELLGQSLAVTISAGMSVLNEDDDAQSIVHRADESLYLAKRSGRNCSAWHDSQKNTLDPPQNNKSLSPAMCEGL